MKWVQFRMQCHYSAQFSSMLMLQSLCHPVKFRSNVFTLTEQAKGNICKKPKLITWHLCREKNPPGSQAQSEGQFSCGLNEQAQCDLWFKLCGWCQLLVQTKIIITVRKQNLYKSTKPCMFFHSYFSDE